MLGRLKQAIIKFFGRLRSIPKLWKILGLVVALLLIVGITSYLYLSNKNKDVVFKIGNATYKHADVEKLIKYPFFRGETDKDKLARQAFDMLKKQAAAKQLGIELADKDIEAAKDSIITPKDA